MRRLVGLLGVGLCACASGVVSSGGTGSPGGASGGGESGGAGNAGPGGTSGNTGGSGNPGGGSMGAGNTGGTSGGGGTGGTAGGGGTGGATVPDKRVVIDPAAYTLIVGKSVMLAARVVGISDPAVSWSVVETSGCGSITATGNYTAPATLPNPPVCRARARSVAEEGVSAEARLMIVNQASGGTPGQWTSIPIPGIQYAGDSGGAQTVVVDPVRPSDFYAFVSPSDGQRTWVMKSTDYGLNWKDVNKTDFRGTPWGGAIDPNPGRDPNTPPALFCPAGFGSNGVWRSTDGGVTFADITKGTKVFDAVNPFGLTDAYGVVVLPDNPPNHVVFTYHYGFKSGGAPQGADGGLGETLDGGATWVVHQPPAGFGNSHYLVPVDAKIWLVIAQANDNKNGIWRTETAGRVNGQPSPSAWKKVDNHEHAHGSFQHYTDPRSGAIYMPGLHGTKRSTDKGLTWQWVHQNGFYVSSVIGTERYLYSNHKMPVDHLRASRETGTPWMPYTQAPANMIGAPPYGNAASFDGQHWILILGGHKSGLWRYVEP